MDPSKCCSQIQNITKIVQDCCPKPNVLKGLAENRWIAYFAYFCAFMPWGIIYAYDFISDRWKTIRETRKEGRIHIVLTLIPVSYVLFYATLQHFAENFQEMAAALTAVVLSILHILRTIWGLAQLSVFEQWIFRALQCLSNMGCAIKMPDGDNSSPRDGVLASFEIVDNEPEVTRKFCSEKRLRYIVNNNMIVNNTLIDNSFHGSELPVRPRKFRQLIKAISQGRFLDALTCAKPEECAIRWSVAFLSKFGAPWLKECKSKDVETQFPKIPDIAESVEHKTWCITEYRNLGVFAFLHVTNHGTCNTGLQHRSLVDPGIHVRDRTHPHSTIVPLSTSSYGDASDSCFPYKNAPFRLALRRFKHTITDAKNSWHALALNALTDDEYTAVDEISGAQIASFLYIFDKDSKTCYTRSAGGGESSDDTHVRPAGAADESVMEQLALRRRMPFSELKNAVPVPNELFYVPLWPHSARGANRLILQGSVHIDNWLALKGLKGKICTVKDERLQNADDEAVFEMQKCSELNRLLSLPAGRNQLELLYSDKYFIDTPRFLGCIMETVRSSIAHWIFHNGEVRDDWEQSLPQTETAKFSISPQLERVLRTNGNHNESVWMRLLWEAQSAMKFALERDSSAPPHTLVETAFLCMLGFPSLTVEKRHDKLYIIRPINAPQNICLSISVLDRNSNGLIEMEMTAIDGEGQSGPVLFKWERWRNAFLGRLYAHSEWRNRKGLEKLNRGLVRASEKSFCEGPKSCIVDWREPESRSQVPMWDGWLPHNPQITFFEVAEQLRLNYESYNSAQDSVLRKAIFAVERVLTGENQVSQLGQFWAEDIQSVIAVHDAAVEEIGRSSREKAFEGFSYCVKEFAHVPSLTQMFDSVLWKNPVDEKEISVLVASMQLGAILLATQTNLDIPMPYERFCLSYVGHIFARIYPYTTNKQALEWSMLWGSASNGYVEDVKETLNPENTRTNLFLAIYHQEIYLGTAAESCNRQAVLHLADWGRSFDSKKACLSIAFLLEKGSFAGRDAHKIYPLLEQLKDEPMAKAILMEQFLAKESLSRVTKRTGHFRNPINLKYCLRGPDAKRNGVKPDRNAALELYTHLCGLTGSSSSSVTEDSVRSKEKSIALNRQGLIKFGESMSAAMNLFRNAASCAAAVHDNLNQYAAINNAGVALAAQALAAQSSLALARQEFEKVVSAGRELEGLQSWETKAGPSIGCSIRFFSKSFSPAVASANNLACVKELMSSEQQASVADEVVNLYEEAAKQGHPVAMYNYAVHLMCRPRKNIPKAHQLLRRIEEIGNELIPMYSVISMMQLLQQLDLCTIKRISWELLQDEIDGCLVCVKWIQSWER